jgi:hypothetical protein
MRELGRFRKLRRELVHQVLVGGSQVLVATVVLIDCFLQCPDLGLAAPAPSVPQALGEPLRVASGFFELRELDSHRMLAAPG